MNKSEVKKWPKCGGEMASGEAMVGYGVWGFARARFRLKKPGDKVGDRIIPYYCKSCGYIEFYKK